MSNVGMRKALKTACLACGFAVAYGCSSSSSSPYSGYGNDAATTVADGGVSDAATTVADGGVSDAAATVVDEGVSDAAATVVDGGVSDGAATVADEGGSDAAQATVLMIASGMRFATPALTVPPGAAITVRNEDSIPHTVTSESGPGAFSPSGVFDTGNIAAGETAMIMIPASATPGTVYYYYCAIHSSLMTPPNGTITVQ